MLKNECTLPSAAEPDNCANVSEISELGVHTKISMLF
jgi:hypothetical protein